MSGSVDVAIINPNRIVPPIAPIGVEYMISALRFLGLRAELVDSVDEALSLRPSLVGLTVRNIDDCAFPNPQFFLPGIRDIVRELKKRIEVPVVAGGVGFSIAPVSVYNYLEVDYGIAGDGEEALGLLFEAIYGRGRFSEVPGLVFREEAGIKLNPSRPAQFVKSPCRLPVHSGYFSRGGQAAVETKRGCDYDCIYCADPVAKGRDIRVKNPSLVCEEFEELMAQGVTHVHLADSEFNRPYDSARELCEEIIRRGLGGRIKIYAYASPAPFDRRLAMLMAEAGFAGVCFGADSACDDILYKLKRNFTVEDLFRTAEYCREAGLNFMFDLLLGGPGENRSSMAETLANMERVAPPCVGIALGMRIYPGTKLARMLRPTDPGVMAHDTDYFLPAFYISPELGENPQRLVKNFIGANQRYMFMWPEDGVGTYNYNDNSFLVECIAQGYRGAYWDIIRRARLGVPPP